MASAPPETRLAASTSESTRGDLAGQFHDAGLLDELIVQVGSVTLGTGKQLFPRRLTSPPLTLVSVRQVGTGFAELRYQVPTNGRAPTS